MKDKVLIKGVSIHAGGNHWEVTVSRKQVEQALKELNEPTLKMGDRVTLKSSHVTEGVVLLGDLRAISTGKDNRGWSNYDPKKHTVVVIGVSINQYNTGFAWGYKDEAALFEVGWEPVAKP